MGNLPVCRKAHNLGNNCVVTAAEHGLGIALYTAYVYWLDEDQQSLTVEDYSSQLYDHPSYPKPDRLDHLDCCYCLRKHTSSIRRDTAEAAAPESGKNA